MGVVQHNVTSSLYDTIVEEQCVVVNQVKVNSLNLLAFLIVKCRRRVSQCQGVGNLDGTFVPKGSLLVQCQVICFNASAVIQQLSTADESQVSGLHLTASAQVDSGMRILEREAVIAIFDNL